jgi:hypothetical protein
MPVTDHLLEDLEITTLDAHTWCEKDGWYLVCGAAVLGSVLKLTIIIGQMPVNVRKGKIHGIDSCFP